MTTPTSVMVECPACGEETTHEVLSGKISGRSLNVLDSTVKCRKCGRVHHVTLRTDKPITVPVVVSWINRSKRSSLELGPDEVVSVGDEVMCGDMPVMITSIETDGNARVETCKARSVGTLWAKRFDKVRVPISVNHHGKTYPEHVVVSPDDEFLIGDIVELGKKDVVIHTIKTESRTLRKGSALAKEIVRIYANLVRKTTH